MLRAFSFLLVFISQTTLAQKDFYVESIKAYQKKYVAEHEVVKKNDKKYFRFFPVSSAYNVSCSFEKITDTIGFTMKASANTLKHYFKYGRLNFKLSGTDYHLFVYQSKDLMQTEQYKNYLFVPFTDLTSGEQSYAGGKYIDLMLEEIKNNTILLDFNKAYNPYCAYATGYNCPIPPRENDLPVAIKAGEMAFGKSH